VDAGDGYLVDVREDDEWDAGHAPDAVHVPLGDLSEAKLAELDEARGDKALVFICRSGNRSAEAAAAAQAAGLENVVSVAGGMGDWVAAGLPLEPQDGEII
jgi:rhodanese-related sulfurtransferase